MIYFPGTEDGDPPILFEYIHHGKLESNPSFKNQIISECQEKNQTLLINPKTTYKKQISANPRPIKVDDHFQPESPDISQQFSIKDFF